MAVATENVIERSRRLAEGEEFAPGRHALRRLGGGHRYEAYLAFDDRLHAIVVAKLVRPHLVADEHTLSGLRAEAAMLDRLDHPVIVRCFDAVTDGPVPHLLLEHLEGPRLSSLVRRQGSLQIEQLVPLALQLCSALHYLAAEGVVHLDVKPANTIMSGPPRLIDLSVAEPVERARALEHPVGTDTYMAPEQCEPGRRGEIGPPTDIWGLGATLYRAATGARAFPAGDPAAEDPAIRWPQLVAAPDPGPLPGSIADPVLACLSPDPGRRPRAAELGEALEPVLRAQARPRLSGLRPRWR